MCYFPKLFLLHQAIEHLRKSWPVLMCSLNTSNSEPSREIIDTNRKNCHGFHFNQCHFETERNVAGWTLAVPVNNYFQLVCLGIAAGKIKWAVRHETGQPHPAR